MTEPLRQHYLQAARAAVGQLTAAELLGSQVMITAADAAVQKDRERMSEQLRNRLLTVKPSNPDIPRRLMMMIEELLFDIAEQISKGMPPTDANGNVYDGPLIP